MSTLRRQLRQARTEHAAARYPGDLAAELLPRPAGGGRPWWLAGAVLVGAAAAAVAVAVVHRHDGPAAPQLTNAAPRGGSLAARAGEPAPVPVAYALPTHLPLTLPVSPLMPASPPVLVSLDGLPASLGQLRQDYEDWPKRMRSFNRRGPDAPATDPAGDPLPEKGSALPPWSADGQTA